VASNQPHSIPVHNQIRGDDPMRLVGEKLIQENVAAITCDAGRQQRRETDGERHDAALSPAHYRDRDWRIGSGGTNFAWKLLKDWF
jgi:hypothetical protein